MHYDLAIVGAGPAGMMLARLAGKTCRTLLIDKRNLAAGVTTRMPWAGKCCGALLAPDAQKLLSEFGLGLPTSVLADPQLFSVRTIDICQRLERYYQRFYINMNRAAFENWLLSLLPGNVDVVSNAHFLHCRQLGNSAEITFKREGRQFTEQADLVIGADGAGSRVRRVMFPEVPLPKSYIAIQEWFQMKEAVPCFSTFFDARLTDYYAWSIPKDGFLAIGAALPPGPTAVSGFEKLKENLQDYGYNLGKAHYRHSAFIERPVRPAQIWTGRGQVALLGEAAGFISPSSAEGFSFALQSALAAWRALQDGSDGFAGRYAAETAVMKRKIISKICKSRIIFSPKLRSLLMKSGFQAIVMPDADSANI